MKSQWIETIMWLRENWFHARKAVKPAGSTASYGQVEVPSAVAAAYLSRWDVMTVHHVG